MIKVETIVVGQLQTNCYLFSDNTGNCFIIDPGDDGQYIVAKIKDLGLTPKAILLTHGHFDHLLAATELKLAFKISLYLNKKDLPILKRTKRTTKFFTGVVPDPVSKVDIFSVDKQKIKTGSLSLQVLATPGHTPGGVSYYDQSKNIVFSGDLIFKAGGYGRTDLSGGDQPQLLKSIKKILSLAKNTIIYPGHGEKTTVLQERKYYKNLLK